MRLLTVEVSGQPALVNTIQALDEALDVTAILDEGAAVIYNRMRTRFLEERDPEGVKWPPSKAALRRARTGRGGGTLFDTGKLFRSIQLYADGPNTRAIGTDVTSPKGYPYGVAHQFGIGIIQRQFLGFADEDLDIMRRVITYRIVKALQQQPSGSGDTRVISSGRLL